MLGAWTGWIVRPASLVQRRVNFGFAWRLNSHLAGRVMEGQVDMTCCFTGLFPHSAPACHRGPFLFSAARGCDRQARIVRQNASGMQSDVGVSVLRAVSPSYGASCGRRFLPPESASFFVGLSGARLAGYVPHVSDGIGTSGSLPTLLPPSDGEKWLMAKVVRKTATPPSLPNGELAPAKKRSFASDRKGEASAG